MYQLDKESLGASLAVPDDEFLAAFESATLPDAAFRHPDHVRLAWIYLTRLPFLEAIGVYRAGLQRFAAAQGAPAKYHETVTWAFLVLINQRLHERDVALTWPEFAAQNPDLLRFKGGALFEHYSQDDLESEVARQVFILPKPRGRTG